MKVTIEIPDVLLMAARHRADREGVTLAELVETGLRAILDERRHAEPFRLRDASFAGTGLSNEFQEASWDRIREACHGDGTTGHEPGD